MDNHRYILKPYRGLATRNTCPGCGYRFEFSRYIDTTTQDEIADHVGRCNRENRCGYHVTPKQFFTENPEAWEKPIAPIPIENECKPIDYLPLDLLEQSVAKYKKCNLYPFLVSLLGEQKTQDLCVNYLFGANKDGDTVFWQIDINENVRQAKVIRYDPLTGKRSKTTKIRFIGKQIIPDGNFKQCLFGEHLLAMDENRDKKIAIVESEKTALILSIFSPEYIWLATGGIYGAKWTEASVCSVLRSKEIVLFPDALAFDKWKAKGSLLANVTGSKVTISDYLERNTTDEERLSGIDIADLLLKGQRVNEGQKGSMLTPE